MGAAHPAEELFRAVGDRTRLQMLALLLRQELAVSELVEVLRLPQSTVSRHLKVLRQAGLIRDRRIGANVLYDARVASSNGAALSTEVLRLVGGQPVPRAAEARLAQVLRRRAMKSAEFFHAVGAAWDELREEAFGRTFHLEAMLSLLPPEWTVADVGCGTGYLLPVLSRYFARVIAVEPVEAMRELAQERCAKADCSNVELRAGELSALPMRDGEADLAMAVLVLHHVPDAEAAVRQMRRVLRGGGQVLIVEQAEHDNAAFQERMQDSRSGFDRQALANLVRMAGFEEVRVVEPATLERGDGAPEVFVLTGRRG